MTHPSSTKQANTVLMSVPFPLTLRNFVPTGLASQIADRFGTEIHLISPYRVDNFSDPEGKTFRNHPVAAEPGSGGLPLIRGIGPLDRLLNSIHLTGFAIEYPDGSLQNITLSSRRNLQWYVARLLVGVAPRRSKRRALLRSLYAKHRPQRNGIAAVFVRTDPAFIVVASPGHQWLDHFVLDEARRRHIPSICIILSWDNLYSRGPLCRRPDFLIVWSEEMKRQAIEVHQFAEEYIKVAGALQFKFYDRPVSESELAQLRQRVGLAPDEPYLAYVCGARTSVYDVEDVLAMLEVLREGPYKHLRVVVRPHPQGDKEAYNRLSNHGVLVDHAPDLIDEQTRPDAFDLSAIRHMASLLSGAEFVVSSWGTTALLEACIFDTPTIQFRWMDSVTHSDPCEVQKVRDFQRYIHMRAFDEAGARLFCDAPSQLNGIMERLEREDAAFREKRAMVVKRLVCLPLGGVIDRVCEGLDRFTDLSSVNRVKQ